MKTEKLLIQDNEKGFKAQIVNEKSAKLVYENTKSSFIKSIKSVENILHINDMVANIEYGDEYFWTFVVDANKTDSLEFESILEELKILYAKCKDEILLENHSNEIKNEMIHNLELDLAASVFDGLTAQLLVFVASTAQVLNLDTVAFDSLIVNISRFKKLVTKELNLYGISLEENHID